MRSIRFGSVALALVVLLAGCSRGGSGEAGGEGEVSEAMGGDDTDPTGPDPCTLVSQAEMERFTGPLSEPPYRIDQNYQPDPAGDQCLYRDRSRRYVILDVDWDGGPLLMQMLGGTALAAEDFLGTRDMSADTLEGTWDQAVITFGRLVALKDSTAVTVDPMGSRLDRGAQARIAALALSRARAPLKYNGAKATRSRPADPAPRDPCSLVTRAEVEALMGPLRADPTTSEDGTECNFVLQGEMLGYPLQNLLKVQWTLGYYALGMERGSTGMAQTVMSQDMGEIPELQQNSGGAGEPWDDEQTLLGGRVTVVARDILFQTLGSGIGGFDEAKAKQLLRIAVRRALGQ
jgi:hypothetical protein